MSRWVSLFMVAALLCVGCSDASREAAGNKSGESPAKMDKPLAPGEESASRVGKEPAPARTTTEGRWQLMVMAKEAEEPAILLDVAPGKEPAVKLVDISLPPDVKLEPKIVNSEVTDSSLKFRCELGEQAGFDFEGTLKDGVIRGAYLAGPVQAMPARMIPSESMSLKQAKASPIPNLDSYKAAIASKETVKAIREFAKNHPTNPMIFTAYIQLLSESEKRKLNRPEVEQIIEEFVAGAEAWGERMTLLARMQSGELVMNQFPDLSRKLFDRVEETLGKESKSPILEVVEQNRKRANEVEAFQKKQAAIATARKQLTSEDPAEQKTGRESLEELRKTDPFNPLILFALGSHAEKTNDLDNAILNYGRIVAFPLLERMLRSSWEQAKETHEPVSDTLATLWKKKHGKEEGLQARLDEIYQKELFHFVAEKAPPRDTEGANKVVNIELFTGSQCPPCVAADVVLGGLEHLYEPTDVLVLRYHQHVPREDPLANSDSEARFFYYEGRGTPTVIVNGRMLNGVGGYLAHVQSLFPSVRELVDEARKEKTEVALSLTAKAEGAKVTLSAKATGLPENSTNLRLRMVLAETDAEYLAQNGIRHHEMLVRSMPGNPSGISPSDGQLAWEGTVDLGELRQKLLDYLAGYEEQQNVSFSSKPVELKKLHFVAMVQDDKSRDILQTAVIPVSGTIELPPEKAPTVPPEPEKKP